MPRLLVWTTVSDSAPHGNDADRRAVLSPEVGKDSGQDERTCQPSVGMAMSPPKKTTFTTAPA